MKQVASCCLTSVATLAALSFALTPVTAYAQSGRKSGRKPSTNTTTPAKKDFAKTAFNAGSLDVQLMAGTGFNLFFPQIGVGAELGILPIGDALTISAGGELNAGYCLVCFLVPLIAPNASITSWSLSPGARVAAHFNIVSKLAEMPELDTFAGIHAAPSYLSTTITVDNNFVTQNVFTFAAGVLAGAKYRFSGNFFALIEYRYTININPGVQTINVNGTDYPVDYDSFVRRDSEALIGVGMRLF